MRLDTLYGPAAPAGRPIQDVELLRTPESRQLLDEFSAEALQYYLSQTADLRISNIFPRIYHLLWVVDDPGDIWFSVEELIDPVNGQLIGILPRRVIVQPSQYVKLGHPSLISDTSKVARMGGEIYFDPIDDRPSYVLTNRSGRYGLRPHQRREHLEAVAGKFNDYGLSFRIRFEEPIIRGVK